MADCITTTCLPSFVSSMDGQLVVAFSILLLVFSFFKILQKNSGHKTFYIYAHVFALVFPIFYFLFTLKCGPFTMCRNAGFLLTIPVSVLGTMIAGYFIVPWIHQRTLKTQKIMNGEIFEKVKHMAREEKIPVPELYLMDQAEPIAFSSTAWKPKIFFSVGLFEVLEELELDAVIWHELYHVKAKAPQIKSLGLFLERISPFFAFTGITRVFKHEEENADKFAIQKQETSEHLNIAKNKLNQFKCQP